jgi:hypothetical protein
VAESSQHQDLIGRIIDLVGKRYGELYALTIRHDLPQLIGSEKPPRIGIYTPDLYAFDTPRTVTIIGEAKTPLDLESEHSRSQLKTFIAYLVGQSRGVFILSVTLTRTAAARRVLSNILRQIGGPISHVEIFVLDEIRLTQILWD